MRLSDKEYYRNIGVVNKEKYSESEIINIVKKSYEALPKIDKDFLEEPEFQIQKIIDTILRDEKSKANPYGTLSELAYFARRSSYYETKRLIWNEFKTQDSKTYHKYNSYMYRIGEKATKYYFDNVDLVQLTGSKWNAILELPTRYVNKHRKIVYSSLVITYDFSNGRLSTDFV